MKTPEEIAKQIANELDLPQRLWHLAVPRIASALRESSKPVPEGSIRTPDGVDRKVLGTLVLTADGAVIGMGGAVWSHYFGGDGKTCESGVLEIVDPDDRHQDEYPAGTRYMLKLRNGDGEEDTCGHGHVWSTRESALSSQGKAQ